jgi:F0F1-type ATP synthase membrane subunit c/vacuolar-type H+-ATPase subunit K
MTTKPQTAQEYFNVLAILHAALISGQVIFGLVALFMNSNQNGASQELADISKTFQFVVPIAVIGGLFSSEIFFRARLKAILQKADLKEKLIDYRAASIVKFALLEGPALFALVVYLVTGNPFFLGVAGFVILLFLFNRPTKFRVANDLQLEANQIAIINDPTAIVA